MQYIYYKYIMYFDNIEYFNEFRIIEGDNLYINRLNDFIKVNNFDHDKPEPDIKHLEYCGYNII